MRGEKTAEESAKGKKKTERSEVEVAKSSPTHF